jgi:hypothetical protein
MTQDQIIQMLRKVIAENQNYTTWTVSTPHLVALVNHAINEEREACAQIAHDTYEGFGVDAKGVDFVKQQIIRQIKERGQV